MPKTRNLTAQQAIALTSAYHALNGTPLEHKAELEMELAATHKEKIARHNRIVNGNKVFKPSYLREVESIAEKSEMGFSFTFGGTGEIGEQKPFVFGASVGNGERRETRRKKALINKTEVSRARREAMYNAHERHVEKLRIIERERKRLERNSTMRTALEIRKLPKNDSTLPTRKRFCTLEIRERPLPQDNAIKGSFEVHRRPEPQNTSTVEVEERKTSSDRNTICQSKVELSERNNADRQNLKPVRVLEIRERPLQRKHSTIKPFEIEEKPHLLHTQIINSNEDMTLKENARPLNTRLEIRERPLSVRERVDTVTSNKIASNNNLTFSPSGQANNNAKSEIPVKLFRTPRLIKTLGHKYVAPTTKTSNLVTNGHLSNAPRKAGTVKITDSGHLHFRPTTKRTRFNKAVPKTKRVDISGILSNPAHEYSAVGTLMAVQFADRHSRALMDEEKTKRSIVKRILKKLKSKLRL